MKHHISAGSLFHYELVEKFGDGVFQLDGSEENLRFFRSLLPRALEAAQFLDALARREYVILDTRARDPHLTIRRPSLAS